MLYERWQVLKLRNADPEEANALTALALRSKRAWGYDDEFMRKVYPDMVVTAEMIVDSQTIVAQDGDSVAGYARLHDLFVEPNYFGQGIGRALFDAACSYARAAGVHALMVVSDPNAEAFYLHLGARRVGEAPSIVGEGRMLPVMRFDIAEDSD